MTQRYAAGSLANTLAPANAGEVVRVALLSRAMGSEGAAFSVLGVSAAVAVMRGSVIGGLFVATAASSVSVQRIGLLAAVVALAACGVFLARRRLSGKVRHVLDVVRGLAAEPLAALEMVGWVGACTGATILASACVGAALGVPHALAAALVIVPAIEMAKLLPITPGNVGLTSAAVAIALHAHGVPLESAVAVGITLHAVETRRRTGLRRGGHPLAHPGLRAPPASARLAAPAPRAGRPRRRPGRGGRRRAGGLGARRVPRAHLAGARSSRRTATRGAPSRPGAATP